MKIFIENCSNVLWLSLNVLRWGGLLVPEEATFNSREKMLHWCYFMCYMVLTAVIVTSEMVALIQGWGDVGEMTGISLLMLTNMAFALKAVNVKLKSRAVQDIIDEGNEELEGEGREEGKKMISNLNKESTLLLGLYIVDCAVTVGGWIMMARLEGNNELLFRAWYPYDASKYPAYPLTFLFQILGLSVVASLNVSMDQMVVTSMTVCRCRFQLLNLSLRTLCEDVGTSLISPAATAAMVRRLRDCVLQHQAVLRVASQLQQCFTTSILVQFSVSIVIICVTAYQLATESNKNIIWKISMTTYFVGMILQVFFYCNEAHKLSEESSLVSDAVYESPWYVCPTPVRRALLIVMLRSRRVCLITAGGLATLSLSCFVAVIRASYSFFTVLNQMEE